jgi:hypothetical protein
MLVEPDRNIKTPPLSIIEKPVVTRLAALVAFVALVADPAVVAEAALPEMLIPQVPLAPVPSALGAPTVP